MPPVVKPPIGIMPEWLWKEQNPSPAAADYLARAFALNAAILRYLEVGMLPRTEWIDELGAASYAAGIRFGQLRPVATPSLN